ncbi:hypothetical protein UFOVP67_71 [uncultured Caudovirales phage]|uniref:Uncharacterized protein n=1 Tax=uncultured Caudovirales phage TaxID=2100421 RepID=A0A6J5TB14_9CAUD|nr:hypothetical protein UFOVP67_71 [uncultured Caudovirales phage]
MTNPEPIGVHIKLGERELELLRPLDSQERMLCALYSQFGATFTLIYEKDAFNEAS